MKTNAIKTVLVLLTCAISLSTLWAQSPEKMSYQAVIRDGDDNLVTDQPVGMQISILQGSASGTAVYVETQTPTTNANGLVSIEIGTGTVESGDFTAIDWTAGPYFIKTETDPAGGTNYTITGTNQILSVPYALHANAADTITGSIQETDPVFVGSVAGGISSSDTTNWNNKIDSETDPVFTTWDKSTGISIIESQISDLGTYVETESDPVFGTSVAVGITESDTANWNNKLDGETQNLNDVLTLNNSAENNNITNLANPSNAQDAATKAYVDALKTEIYSELLAAGLNGAVMDADSNAYLTVQIGNQIWMAENLKTTKYLDSTNIPLITDDINWDQASAPAFCWYNNDSSTYAQTYGALYNWYAIETGDLCPAGWHVPSDEEWKQLEMALGMSQAAANSTGYRGTNEGSKLAGNATLWTNGSLESDPSFGSSGFDALPAGYRTFTGSFLQLGVNCFFWSNTEEPIDQATYRDMGYADTTIGRHDGIKGMGLSVRCVKD